MTKQPRKKIPTYTPRQRMLYKECECDSKQKPPGWLLDQIAEEKLYGGFKIRKKIGRNKFISNVCGRCYVTKSANGSCNCT
jgi:hypothetical protein